MLSFRLLSLACVLSAVASAQLVTPTLVNAPDSSTNQMVLSSSSGLIPGSELYIDREAMRIYSLAGPVATVYRGVDGTKSAAHASGVTAYGGPSSLFWASDQSGTCTEPSTIPRIAVQTGLRWYCSGGSWAAANSGGGASIPLVSGALRGDGLGGASAVTGSASDCVKVDGSSAACATGGTAQIAANGGTAATARTIIDFMDGSAATWVVTDTGTRIQVTASAAAGMQSKIADQSSAHLLCSAGSTTTLTCTMSPTLTTYTNGMLVNLCVTGAITGATTLNIDTLGAKSLLTFAGGNPASGDLGTGCRLVTYKSADTSFRLPAGASAGGVTTTNAAYPMPVGGCANAASGTYFAWGLGGNVTGDCRGPNSSQPVLMYLNTASGYAAYSFRIPQDWNGGTFSFIFREAQGFGGSGNLKWDVSLSCVALNAADYAALTYNTASTTGSVVNNAINKSYERTVTAIDVTGCSAGQAAVLKLARDTSVSGNIADSGQSVYVMFPELRYTRQ